MLMVRVGDAPSDELLQRARQGLVGGVIVFPTSTTGTTEVPRVIDDLQDAARAGDNPPLFVAVDQEGGDVKRFEEDPPIQSPAELGAAGGEAAAHAEGKSTATFLRGLGVNMDLAPVLDLAGYGAFIAPRAFGSDPDTVSEVGGAFARGLEAGGVIPVGKHFPGLGLAVASTDVEPSEVDASVGKLRPGLEAFQAAIRDRIPAIMVAIATYDALDPKRPAATSRAAIDGLLRGRLGFQGVVMTDDLQAGAVQAVLSPGDAAVDAARAGADVLLFARDEASGIDQSLIHAERRGILPAKAIRDSCARVVELKRTLG
jgi:beta-N-acetylhexosaminidase